MDILNQHLKTSVRKLKLGRQWVFHIDYDTKHKRTTKSRHWSTSQSPDLNPIENVTPFFLPNCFFSSYNVVSSLQLPYELGRDEGRKSCVLRYTTQPSRKPHIPTGQTLPNPDDARPIVRRPKDLPVAAGYDRAWAQTQSLWWHSWC